MEENEELSETNKIFKTLMHFPGSTFSDLWDKEVESNKFTYYLKKLENEDLIKKEDGKYYLTVKGKSQSTTICGETGKEEKRPAVTLLLVIKNKDKYILYKRFKEPYYGFCGFPGAKMKRGEEILDAAKRELKEETNLESEGRIISIQNVQIINDDSLFHHMVQFVVLFKDPKGELIKESREGTYEWATKEEILSQKNLFPDIPNAIKLVEEREFLITEMQFIQKNEKFVETKIKKIN
jgi:ADP-ribose pyrophosphatase YjhB (NUDIX family)